MQVKMTIGKCVMFINGGLKKSDEDYDRDCNAK